MIIGMNKNKDHMIGKITTAAWLTDENQVIHYNVRIMFIRKATKEEYLAELKENNVSLPDEEGFPIPNDACFYQISID